MAVEIIIGNNLYDVSEAVISSIKISNSLELENFIVVPDRFSLIAEKMVFQTNNIISTFNTKVIGISKLAAIFSTYENVLTADESILKIYSILKKTTFSFFCPTLEISNELYNIIAQLKSNNISYNNFKDSAKTTKLQQIAKIYEIYEKDKEELDQNDLLSNLINNIDLKKVNECNFYFAGFDSLTQQGEKILETLILNSKRVVIGAVNPNEQKNKFVYDPDIIKKLNKICKKNKIFPLKTMIRYNHESMGSYILENLYCLNPMPKETENLFLLKFGKLEDEVTEISKVILNKIKIENKKFSDFNILIGDLEESYSVLEEVFNRYNIPYFIDCSIKLESLPIYAFFKTLFELFLNFDILKFINFLHNPYIYMKHEDISNFYNYILKNNMDLQTLINWNFNGEFEEIKGIAIKIKESLNCFKNEMEFSEFAINISKIIKIFNLKEKNDYIIKKINNEKYEKIYLQLIEKIEEILLALNKQNQVLSAEEFFKLFLSLIGEKEVSSIPVAVDCVFVGNNKSFFEKRKVLFVMNAKQGAIPKTIKDLSILCDDDINKTELPINPTVRIINKRNKQKILFDLSLSDELFVSYNEGMGEKIEKSSIFNELQKIFIKGGKKISIMSNFYEYLQYDKFLDFLIKNEYDFLLFVLNLINIGEISKEEASEVVEFDIKKIEKISNANLIFKKLSPTSIENFCKCPFKHFFDYGLKIKPNQTNVIDYIDYGNYFHSVAELFIKNNFKKIGGIEEGDISIEFEKAIKKVEENDRFKLLKQNPNNNHAFIMLRKEALEMVKKINYEQKYSNFIAKYLEKNFSINIDGVPLNGVVDRIDIAEDYFRVVDYKSGNVSKSLKEVYMGTELQLLIYLIAIEKLLGLKIAGGFYFPIGIDFNKEKDLKKFCLDGFVLNQKEIIKNLDRRFGKNLESDIVSLKLSKKSTLDNLILSSKKNVFSTKGFTAILEYVKKFLKKIKNNILSGEFIARPVGTSFDTSPCRFCNLYCVCSFKENINEKFRDIPNELSEEDFLRIVENGK